ncbi:hypothetical protein [Flindersiella endophytica]
MVSLADAATSARAHVQADAGRLWGRSLAEVEWMGITDDEILLTADPGVAGYEPVESNVWAGPRPAGIAASNTPQAWAGRTWATVVLPLPDDQDAVVRLLVHEAFHVVQGRLFPGEVNTEVADGMDLLDSAEGRTWLRMELAALGAALESTGAERVAAAADALVFHSHRLAAALPSEASRERELEIWEGLPEYTAWRLTEATPSEVARHARSLPADAAWARSFAYVTGPAYGFLLDALGPGWTAEVVRQRDLQALLAAAVADARGAVYGLSEVRRTEGEREGRHRERVDGLRQAYATGPLLRLSLDGQMISFNPQDVVPLDDGVHRGNLSWRNGDGSFLEAPRGALVTQDFSEIRLVCPEPPEVPGTTTGDGWTLRLADGWQAEAVDGGWKILRQQGD